MSLLSTIDKYRKRIKIIKQSNIYSLVFIFVIFIVLVIILVLMFDQIMPMKDSDIKKCETQIYNIHEKAYDTPGKEPPNLYYLIQKQVFRFTLDLIST